MNAGVAQLVEQLICNHQVVGSIPITSFLKKVFRKVKLVLTQPLEIWYNIGILNNWEIIIVSQ